MSAPASAEMAHRRGAAVAEVRHRGTGSLVLPLAMAASVAVVAATVLWGRAGWPNGRLAALAQGATALSWAAPGAIVARRRPQLIFGWLLLGGGLCLAAGSLGSAYGADGLAGDHLFGAVWAAWLGTWLFFPHLGAMEAVYLLFPDGRLPSRRWPPALLGVVAVNVIMLPVAAVQPHLFDQQHWRSAVANPVGASWAAHLFPVVVVGQNLAYLAGLVALGKRWRRSTGDTRSLLRLVLVLGVLGAVEGALLVHPPGPWVYLLAVPSTMLLTVAVAAGVLRYRLWDIRIVLSRTLSYLVLTALVVALFAGTVALAGLVIGANTGPAAVVATAAVTAVAVAPAQRRIQTAVERLFYGQRREPYAVLSSLGAELERAGDPHDALHRLVDAVTRSLRLSWAAIELEVADSVPTVITTSPGPGEGPTVRLPLRYHDRPLGALVVALRSGESTFSASDRRLLDDLARQASAAAHAAVLTDDLLRSRERLVTAREEERRGLRRDLHDGVASALTAMGLKTDTAVALMADDPNRAGDILRGLRDDVGATLDDVRRLVSDMRPPILDDLGLAGALDQLAARYDSANLTVTFARPPAFPRLPAAIEVAAYHIGTEALQNVARHAHAKHCAVSLAIDDGALTLCVDDDGTGVAPAGSEASPGVGMTSMAERAEELGGGLTIQSRPGRTLVAARIPLRGP